MLLCEDILLLGTDDETGARRSTMGQLFELVIAGALLNDLTLAGQVRLTEPGEDVRRNRVVAVPEASAADDNLLLITRARLEQKRSWEMTYAVRVLQKNLVRLLYGRLIAAEMITREDHMALGFIPYRRCPSVDGSHDLGLLAAIGGVLFEARRPTTTRRR